MRRDLGPLLGAKFQPSGPERGRLHCGWLACLRSTSRVDAHPAPKGVGSIAAVDGASVIVAQKRDHPAPKGVGSIAA